jgi:hypothetical protein
MTRSPPHRRRTLALTTAMFLFLGVALAALATPVAATPPACTDGNSDTPECNNSGDVKVHTFNDTGSEKNDPHVDCPFYVEGFNMDASSGTLVIKSWPPTGDKSVVLSDTWTADAGTPANHFLNGPYSLPSGHYKLFVSDTQHDKHKVFWVDCPSETTSTTTGPGCVEGCQTSTTTTTTEIPFFPSAAALGVGVLGAIGGTLFMLRRRL